MNESEKARLLEALELIAKSLSSIQDILAKMEAKGNNSFKPRP
jgi:hypothetical protein